MEFLFIMFFVVIVFAYQQGKASKGSPQVSAQPAIVPAPAIKVVGSAPVVAAPAVKESPSVDVPAYLRREALVSGELVVMRKALDDALAVINAMKERQVTQERKPRASSKKKVMPASRAGDLASAIEGEPISAAAAELHLEASPEAMQRAIDLLEASLAH